MAKRKISNLQRLIAFAMEVGSDELDQLSEVIGAIRDARFPKAAKAKPRAPRSDKGSRRQQSHLNPPDTKADGGDNELSTV